MMIAHHGKRKVGHQRLVESLEYDVQCTTLIWGSDEGGEENDTIQ